MHGDFEEEPLVSSTRKNNKSHQITSMTLFWCLCCDLGHVFDKKYMNLGCRCGIFIVYFERISHSFRCFRHKDQIGIHMFKINNGNTRAMCEICSKLRVKTPDWRQWHRSGVSIGSFEQVSGIILAFLLLTLNK